MKKPSPPSIDLKQLYSTREVAVLAGKADDRKGIAAVSILLKRHGIGSLVGHSRVIPGMEVARAIELIQSAQSGNPKWIKDAKKKT